MNLSTTDSAGSPVSADLALWTVDKAIFELSDNKLGNIFETFWDKRYNSTREAHSLEGISVQRAEMGGCFAEGTKILTPAGLKNIEDVKAGDYILTRSETDPKLVKARVQRTENVEEEGYMILNGHLKVTPNHILRINNAWKEAGSAQAGDILIDDRGKKLKVTSVEWQQGKTKVYNLEIEKYHTFFADGVWVHNDKGMSRNAFKDMAYWNPSIHTDSSGRARVTFKLPDNLTTWTLAAVGSTQATMVGQATTEIVATKDIIVRPIIPNILRTGDEIILSALVQNFTQKDHNFDIGLKF
ncbi:MAG: alpha-2-macroglobulin family protein, partial [Dehalococcoidia bacterium]|nr:alpha-2-macroglobulin family protein [Dehalococcoidia bacterium]